MYVTIIEGHGKVNISENLHDGMLNNKKGIFPIGQTVKAVGFIVIAIGGGYASLSQDFRVGSLIIAIGALIIAVGEFL